MNDEQRQLLARMKPFVGQVALPVVARLSDSEFAKVRAGFTPQVMEHKWFICFDDPFLLFYRSWSNSCVYRMELARQGPDVVVKGVLWDPQSSEVDEAQVTYQTELATFMLLGYLVGRDLKPPVAPAVEPRFASLHAHHVVGHRPPDASVGRKARPWWKFW